MALERSNIVHKEELRVMQEEIDQCASYHAQTCEMHVHGSCGHSIVAYALLARGWCADEAIPLPALRRQVVL